MITIGSLCSGAGMLDLAVEAHHGAKTIWFCENAPDPSLVLAERFPGVPNYGDLTTTDWDQIPRVDILTAGFPCQPISASGRQKGREDQRWIWDDILAVVRTLQPRRVVLENVRNLLAIDEGRCMAAVVLGLAELGYLGRWGVVRASEAGAPHRRERVFIVADASGSGRWEVPRGSHGDEGTDGRWSQEDGHKLSGSPEDTERPEFWREYWPAIERWGRLRRRSAPRAFHGNNVSAHLTEWMLGLRRGFVTDVLSNARALRVIGNGVVPQQGLLGLRMLDGLPTPRHQDYPTFEDIFSVLELASLAS